MTGKEKQEDLFARLDPDEQRERVLAKEVALVLVAHVGRPMDPREPMTVAVDLGKRIANMARRRFSENSDEKKET